MNIKKKISSKLNGLIRRGYWFNNILFPDCRKFWKQETFNLDVVNLGSNSGKYAFSYDKLNIKAANWAMGPQSLVADYEILRNYSSFLKEGAVVIIPLCPFSCLGGSSEFMDDKYYTILKMKSIPHSNYKQRQKVLSQKQNPLNYYPIMALYKDIRSLFRKKECELSKKEMQADAERWITNWMFEFSIDDFNFPMIMVNKDAYDSSVKILSNTIQFCLDRKFKPILVIPPMTNYLSSMFSPKMREQLIDKFVLKANIQDIPFYNYMDDDSFSKDLSLFRNSYFMNETGAIFFSKRFLNDIECQHS